MLTDSSVNCYGFRLLTDGYIQTEFEKNPIGYYMHEREEGVVLRWEDFRKDADKVFAKPVINLSNERGQQTVEECENGFLNGASVGNIVALEWSEDPSMMLPGQTGPTITKWYNRECSLVDVPGNFNALTLYDKDGNVINLAAFTKNSLTMEKTFLTPEQLSKLGLKADSKQSEVDQVIENLMSKAAKADDLQTKLDAANTAKTTAETALQNLKDSTADAEVDTLLGKAKDESKITANAAAKMKEQFKGKPAELKAVLDVLQPHPSITGSLKTGADANDLTAKSWNELDRSGKLEDLRAKDENAFFDKFKAEFNKPHKDDKRA